MKPWKTVLVFVASLRVAVVGLLFIQPHIAEVLTLLLDGFDSGVAYKAGYSWRKYTKYDKALDYWWYIFVLLFCFNTPIFNVMLVLFAIRSVGQILTILTAKHELLFWFPNIFEHYFILYLLAVLFPKYLVYFSGWLIIIPLFIATITKMPQEYILHRKGWFYNSKDWSRSITSLLVR